MAIVPLRYLASMNESRTTTRGPVEYWQRGQTLLLVGVGLTLAGIAYDAYWHSHHGALDVGIPAPHYVTLLGMVVALRRYRRRPREGDWPAADRVLHRPRRGGRATRRGDVG